jgi:hypothetical protein
MLRNWVNFANSGNPNGTGLVSWPEYQGLDDCFFEIKASTNAAVCGIRTAESNLGYQIAGFTACTGPTGVLAEENAGLETFKLFPNPASHQIQLKAPHSMNPSETISFQVISTTGKCLMNTEASLSETEAKMNQFLPHLPSGLYFVKVKCKGEYSGLRFVKE